MNKSNTDEPVVDQLTLVSDSDQSKLDTTRSKMFSFTMDGYDVQYLRQPDEYSLELLVRADGYEKAGLVQANKITADIFVKLGVFQIPIGADVLIVENLNYSDIYYRTKPTEA